MRTIPRVALIWPQHHTVSGHKPGLYVPIECGPTEQSLFTVADGSRNRFTFEKAAAIMVRHEQRYQHHL